MHHALFSPLLYLLPPPALVLVNCFQFVFFHSLCFKVSSHSWILPSQILHTYLFMHKICFSAKAEIWAGGTVTHLMFLLSNSRIAGGVKPAQQKQHTSHRAWAMQRGALLSLGFVCSLRLTAFPPCISYCAVSCLPACSSLRPREHHTLTQPW